MVWHSEDPDYEYVILYDTLLRAPACLAVQLQAGCHDGEYLEFLGFAENRCLPQRTANMERISAPRRHWQGEARAAERAERRRA